MSISRAIALKDIDRLRAAIHNGEDVNKVIFKPGGYTPLHVAVRDGNLEIIQELLKNGAKVNSIDNNGNTPLHSAAQNSPLQINLELINNGADPMAKNKRGQIPLHVVGENAHGVDITAIANAHIAKGADVEALDMGNKMPKDNTVLHDALLDYFENKEAKEALQELTATNGPKLEDLTRKVIDMVLDNHYGITKTEGERKENQKDLRGEDDKKTAAIKDKTISDPNGLNAFTIVQPPAKSKANTPNERTNDRHLSADQKKGPNNSNKRKQGRSL